MWAPLPLLILVILDWTFPLYFWRIPKLTGRSADYGYQFLRDVHEMEFHPAADSVRVLAIGSSVAGSFDPAQVQTLLTAQSPSLPVDVHRLLKPSMKPSDYRLFFDGSLAAVRPDVAVVMVNLQDFQNSSLDRDLKPDVQSVLPPWTTLLERYHSLSVPEMLDLLLASASNFYRYRTPLRSAIEDHVQAAASWLRHRDSGASYGIYPDHYTKRRFRLAVPTATSVDLEYFIHPAWIQQRGTVTIDFSSGGHPIATRVETNPGWKTVHLALPAAGDGELDVIADSTWNPRAAGMGDDLRLLGVQLRSSLPAASGTPGTLPFRYPPVDDHDVDEFLRMAGTTGGAYAARWQAALDARNEFGGRLRAWRDQRLALRHTPFDPQGEYDQLEGLIKDLAQHGISVVLVNTPESPLFDEYQDTPYYRGYREFFRDLAARNPHVQFYDLLNALPAEDFNDVMHATYMGVIKLGPQYADMVAGAIRERARNPPPSGSEAHIDELLRSRVAP